MALRPRSFGPEVSGSRRSKISYAAPPKLRGCEHFLNSIPIGIGSATACPVAGAASPGRCLQLSMKKLLLVILVIAGLIFVYYKYWTSDSNERRLRNNMLNCLDSKLKILEASSTYQSAFKQASNFYQKQKDSLKTFVEIKVPVERVFDKCIFFNHDSTRCILMLLEKYPGDFHNGYVHIIQGDLLEQWNFSMGMHISFPEEDIKSLFPKEFNSGIRQYTFDMLSKRSRIAVLNISNKKIKGCDIDEEWWFKKK